MDIIQQKAQKYLEATEFFQYLAEDLENPDSEFTSYVKSLFLNIVVKNISVENRLKFMELMNNDNSNVSDDLTVFLDEAFPDWEKKFMNELVDDLSKVYSQVG